MTVAPGPETASEWGSFRDPDGQVAFTLEGPVHRQLTASGVTRARAIAGLYAVRQLQQGQHWVAAEAVDGPSPRLIHPRVFFPSYPHEWPPTMLHRAAALTLAANAALITEGWELKDATPTNVLFEGTRPVFIDFMSPMERDPAQMGWRAYGQFARTFLIPLLLHRTQRIPLRWMFLAHRDGVPPDLALSMLGPLARFLPAAFGLVTLPVWMARLAETAPTRGLPTASAPDVATSVTRRILSGLSRRLAHLAPPTPRSSAWSDYQDLGISYTPDGLTAKEAFVAEALATCQPATVLDLGCNTGKFSHLAAQAGARVVALDADPACLERIFLEAEAEGLDIQPLVADLGRPAPRLGWGYREEFSLLDRLEGRFDLTLALALIHHLMIRERVPLSDVVSFIAHTTRRFAVIEWIGPEDPQFQRLAGTNADLYEGLTAATFEAALIPVFRIQRTLPLPGFRRTLYLLEKR